jgi:hypothetical protein
MSFSDYGIRAVSAYHRDHPYVFDAGGQQFVVNTCRPSRTAACLAATPTGAARSGSVNYMLVRALQEFDSYYGDTFKVECPVGSGNMHTLGDVANDLTRRLIQIFLRDPVRGGRRAVWGDNDYFQTDPHWCDYILFQEYFHGDTGAGVGASHQTGWTALVASLLMDVGKPEEERA